MGADARREGGGRCRQARARGAQRDVVAAVRRPPPSPPRDDERARGRAAPRRDSVVVWPPAPPVTSCLPRVMSAAATRDEALSGAASARGGGPGADLGGRGSRASSSAPVSARALLALREGTKRPTVKSSFARQKREGGDATGQRKRDQGAGAGAGSSHISQARRPPSWARSGHQPTTATRSPEAPAPCAPALCCVLCRRRRARSPACIRAPVRATVRVAGSRHARAAFLTRAAFKQRSERTEHVAKPTHAVLVKTF